MDFSELKLILINSLNDFFQNDIYLIKNSVQEETISHRIAVYLEKYFQNKEYNIDCEYNKANFIDEELPKYFFSYKLETLSDIDVLYKGNNIKFLLLEKINNYYIIYNKENKKSYIKKKVNGLIITINEKNSSFRPDIIIHKRGDGENNLVAFELKKCKLSGKDKIKLKALTNKNLNFAYKYGVGLSNFIYGDKSVEILIFENGEIKDTFTYKDGEYKKP